MIDAPVSGGPVGVRAGTLTFMAGGPNEAFELFASLSEYDGDQGGTLWPIRDWPCYEAMQQSYPGQSIGGLVLLGASHFGAYHPSFGQCRELIRWPSPKGCYWVFLWDWHRNFWLRLSTAPQVTSLALPPLNHFSRNLSVLGRSWSSEVNNPSPGALKDKSPPCERKYKGGFASKLMLKVGN